MIEPQIQPLIGYPKAWSPGTGGVVTGDVVQVIINTPADMEKYRGKLRGKIVLPQPERAVRMLEGTIVLRMGEKEVKEAESTPIPSAGGARVAAPAIAPAALNKFYLDEGVVAVLDRGSDTDMSAGGATCRGRRNAWMAARSSSGAAEAATPNAPPSRCRSRSRWSTTIAWCASSRRECR